MYYATAMPFRGTLLSLLVESTEGRPTKIEGNPEHPVSRGASGIFEQASLLNLYDPDRSKTVLHNNAESNWDDFVAQCRGSIGQCRRRQIAVLSEPSSSPTVLALRGQLAEAFPSLQWMNMQPTPSDGADPVLPGMYAAYGRVLRPWYQLDRADVIVSFDLIF